MSVSDLFLDRMRSHTEAVGTHPAMRFLKDGEVDGRVSEWTYSRLDLRARAIANELQSRGLQGERVVLVFLPGMDFVQALLGCLYAGAVAVPVYPPEPSRLAATLPRFQAIVEDADAKLAMTSTSLLALSANLGTMSPSLAGLQWIGVGDVDSAAADSWSEPTIGADDIALLQYTSGSTSTPKGVAVSQAQLAAQLQLLYTAQDVQDDLIIGAWLPFYHDFGLIGGILHPLYAGGSTVLMSPLHFLQKPSRWLHLLSRYRCNVTGSPTFGLAHATRKVTDSQLEGVDLGSVRRLGIGGEVVQADVVRAFTDRFAAYGLHPHAPQPSFGQAECVLAATVGRAGAPLRTVTVDTDALGRGRVEMSDRGRTLVGNGPAVAGTEIVVVDPETRAPTDQVGELWVRGPHVAMGYWRAPEATRKTFGATTADGSSDWLRTGDVAFVHQGDVYIAGRASDRIIVRGRNIHPEDVEAVIAEAHPAVRPAGIAVVGAPGPDGAEELVVLAECREADAPANAVLAAMQACLTGYDMPIGELVLVAGYSLPKTSSGKIQRANCRAALQAGLLSEVGRARARAGDAVSSPAAAEPTTLRERVVRAVASSALVAESGVDDRTIGTLDSIALADLHGRLGDIAGYALSPRFLHEHVTVDSIVSALETEAPDAPNAPVPPSVAITPFQWDILADHDTGWGTLVTLHVERPLSAKQVQAATDALVRHHDLLGSRVDIGTGRIESCEGAPSCPVHVLGLLTDAQAAADALGEAIAKPFDLDRPPLLRAGWAPLADGSRVVALCAHHLLYDAHALRHMVQQWFVAMLGGQPVDGGSWLRWAARRERAASSSEDGPWWTQALSGHHWPVPVPHDVPVSAPTLRLAGTQVLDATLAGGLNKLARSLGVTLNGVSAFAFGVALAALNDVPSVVFGTPVSLRTSHDADVVGPMVEDVLVPVQASGAQTVAEAVGSTAAHLRASIAHVDMGLRGMVACVPHHHDSHTRSACPALHVFDLGEPPTRGDGWRQVVPEVAPPTRHQDYLARCVVADGVTLSLRVQSERVGIEAGAQLFALWCRALAGCVTSPDSTVDALRAGLAVADARRDAPV